MVSTKPRPWTRFANIWRDETMPTKRQERIIHGVVAAVGTAIGKAVRTFDPLFVSFNFKLRPEQVRKEVERFRRSVGKSREQLKRMQTELKKKKSGPESSFLID